MKFEVLCDPCAAFPWGPIPAWMHGKSVEARNALQNCGRVHPFTCGDNECRKTANQAPLRAVENGWVCDHCGYTQSNTENAKSMNTPETDLLEKTPMFLNRPQDPICGEALLHARKMERGKNEAKAILENVCFHLRRNDHVTPPTGATCTNQMIDRIDRFLLENA